MTDAIQDATDCHLLLTCKAGTWTLTCRPLALETIALESAGGFPEAARQMLCEANEFAQAMGAAAGAGFLTAPGQRRLSRARTLMRVLGRLVTPE